MIATTDTGAYLVECHIPLSFIRSATYKDKYYHAFMEWKTSITMYGMADARKYGKINRGKLSFWVNEVGDLHYYRGWGFFEMYIRSAISTPDIYDCLNGKYGGHFFLINLEIDKMSREFDEWADIWIKRFLTPVLIAEKYPEYEETMDDIFGTLVPYFQGEPSPLKLPKTSLR